MKDWIFLKLERNPHEDTEKKLGALNELLNGIGVHFEVDRGEEKTQLVVEYDEEEIKKRVKRNAGAKPKQIGRWNDVSIDEQYAILTEQGVDALMAFMGGMGVSVAEIRDRMSKGETAEEIAKSFGISRNTLFTKLRKAKERGLDYIS